MGRWIVGKAAALLLRSQIIHVIGELEPRTKLCLQETPCTLRDTGNTMESPSHPSHFGGISGPSLILIYIFLKIN